MALWSGLNFGGLRVGKPAIQQIWKSALPEGRAYDFWRIALARGIP